MGFSTSFGAFLLLGVLPQAVLLSPLSACNSSIHFDCKIGTTRRCIPMEWHCDNIVDCEDGSDEVGCSYLHECSPGQMMCRDGACISKSFKCDGEIDCMGGHDEHECDGYDISHLRSDDNVEQAPSSFLVNNDCPPSSYKCNSGHQCISKEALCDGVPDCSDGEDEEGCRSHVDSTSSIMSSSFPAELDFCPFGHQRCKDNSACIPTYWTCDGEADCDDGSDEMSCEDGEIDASDVFKVLPIEELCKSKCQHGCNVDGQQYKCYCLAGYKLAKDGHSCHVERSEEGQIFLAIGSEIRRMPLSDPAHSKFAYQTVKRLGSHRIAKNLDYNTYNNLLYVVSSSGNVGDLMVYDDNNLTVIRGNVSGLEYVATDYMSGNVYYTQQAPAEAPGIYMCSSDASNCRRIIEGQSSHPTDNSKKQLYRGLSLDPASGMMYWMEGFNNKFRIMSASMDGSDARVMIDNKLESPRGLALDPIRNELYFGDAGAEVIEKIAIGNRERHVVLSRGVHQPYHVAFFDGRLYWTDWKTETLKFVEISEHHTSPDTMHHFSMYPNGVAIQHPSFQNSIGRNPCERDACSSSAMCVPVPDSFRGSVRASCICPEDMFYSNEVNTCVPTKRSIGERDSYVDDSASTPGWSIFWFLMLITIAMSVAFVYLYRKNAAFNELTKSTIDKANDFTRSTINKVHTQLRDSSPPTVVTFNNPVHSEEQGEATQASTQPEPIASVPEVSYTNKFVQ